MPEKGPIGKTGILFQSYTQFDNVQDDPQIVDSDLLIPNGEWYKTARIIRCDPTIALARAMVAAPIIKNGWRVRTENERAKEVIEKVLFPHRRRLMKQAVYSLIDFGWQSWEIRSAGDFDGVTHIKFKPLRPDYTEIITDGRGRVKFVKNQSHHSSENRPVKLSLKNFFLAYANEENDNPYGHPLLKNVESVYTSYNEVEAGARRYSERVAGSHWILYYPTGETLRDGEMVDNYLIANEILDNLSSSSKIAMPVNPTELLSLLQGQGGGKGAKDSGWMLDLLTADTGMDPFLERQRYLDALKMRGLLSPERVALEGQFGTKAESSEHADIGLLVIEELGQSIVDCFNEYYGIVHRVLEYNGFDVYPGLATIEPLPLSDEDKSYLREIFRSIVNNTDFAFRLIDLQELASRAGIPINENVTVEQLVEEAQQLQDRQFQQQMEMKKQNSQPTPSEQEE